MFGPDAKSLIVTLLLILVPVVIFCAFVARDLVHEFPEDNSGYAIPVVAVVFTIYVCSLNPPFICGFSIFFAKLPRDMLPGFFFALC